MTRKASAPMHILTVINLLAAILVFPAIRATGQRTSANHESANVSFAPAVTYGSQVGTLSFLPIVNYGTGGDIAQIDAIADLNGDGKPDVIVSSWYEQGGGAPGVVGVLLGNGDGTLQPVVTYASGGAPNYWAAVADVNGDGKPDILLASCVAAPKSCGSADGVVSVLLGNGNGTFQKAVTYDAGGLESNGLAVADVNRDGVPDVIVTNHAGESNGDGSVGILLGNGDGTFKTVIVYDSGGLEANAVAVADVNGDGKPDLIVANYCAHSGGCASGSVGVLLGNGDGTLQPVVTYATGGSTTSGVVVGDLNNDGFPDLIVGNLGGVGVGVLLNLGNGEFGPVVTYNVDGYVNQPAVGDVNLDGNLDIIAPTNTEAVAVLLGNGDGTFQPVVTFPSGGPDANTLAVGDMNGDGKPDIVVTNGFGNLVGVLLNNTTVSACTGKCSTTTTLTSSLNPSIYGQSVTFTATVTTTGSIPPIGTVVFSWSGNVIGTATLNSGGVATLMKSNLNADSFPLVATYKGDTNNLGSTSAIVNLLVEQATSSATLTSSPNPSTADENVTFTAHFTSPTVQVKGPVTFTEGKTVLGTVELSGGKAKLTTSSLAAGSTKVNVTYEGDSDIQGCSASVEQVVQ
jgi:Bacterial Ig-like domain (group 3)/FG-GAP-like repeat